MLGKIKGPEKPDSQRTNQRTKKRFDFRNIQMFFFLVQLHLALELIL